MFVLIVAIIWYTGLGERGTGNWCFKDGVVTFEDIFALYFDHFRGKVLTLVCDCSYSGSWVVQCAKKLDEIGIASCGHHTREKGIFIKVVCSCSNDQQASLLVFCEEAVDVDEKKKIWYSQKQLTSGQTCKTVAFTDIQCCKTSEEACEVPKHYTWMDRLFNAPYIYLVRGRDGGRPAWHYVLVDKEKDGEFKAQMKTGNIDVANFGKVLLSGWDEDPPDEKIKEIADRFTLY